MGLSTGLAIAGIAGAGIGAVGSLGAASTQASASENAAQLQYQLGEQSLGFQEQEYNQGQQNLAPWLQSGRGALGNLDYLLGIGSPSPGQPSFPGTAGTMPTATGPGTTNPFGSYANTTGIPGGAGVGPARPMQSYAAGPGAIPTPSMPMPGEFTTGTGRAAPGEVPFSTSGAPSARTAAGSAAPFSPLGFRGPSQGAGQTVGNASPTFGELAQTWNTPFASPTLQQAEQTPGYQFQLQQGLGALQNSAASRGGLLTGNTGEALQQYGQGLAQTDYNNVYNQSLQNYLTNFNVFNQNQANLFNRYASLAGMGQTTAQQLGTLGNQAAGNIAGINSSIGGQVGTSLQNAGAATASGYAGAANAGTSALGNLSQYYLLNQLLNGGGGSTPASPQMPS